MKQIIMCVIELINNGVDKEVQRGSNDRSLCCPI